jgi:hypothetical protein
MCLDEILDRSIYTSKTSKQAQMVAGIGVLLATASRILAGQRREAPLILMPASEDDGPRRASTDRSWLQKEKMLSRG